MNFQDGQTGPGLLRRLCGAGGGTVDWLRAVLEGSPMLALFIAIGIGYALGQIPVLGVALGAGAHGPAVRR
jgi:hypothetical protein